MLDKAPYEYVTAKATVMDLVFGRWRSQIIFSAVNLGIFDALAQGQEKDAGRVASDIGADEGLLYRLLRAVASLGLAVETADGIFSLTDEGELLCSSHPESLRDMVMLEEGPEHYAIWAHLSDMVKDGVQNGFMREYGQMAFDYAKDHSRYDDVFKQAMSSFSSVQTGLALEALQDYDFSPFGTLCDIAGGQGHMLCSFLQHQPHLKGIVFDQPHVVADEAQLWAAKMQVDNRCRYIGGDMFDQVPAADAYMLKMILHDWNDDECISILQNIRQQAHGNSRVFVVEHIVPDVQVPHFSKLYDIHMMCWGTGRERTVAEYADLFAASGWSFEAVHYPGDPLMGVVEAIAV